MTMTLTLLGTAGGPGGHPTRAGIASLISLGDAHYLVDAGEGVSRQLARAGVDLRSLRAVLLTHLHDDHTAGLPGLTSFRHTMRGAPFDLLGPVGTEGLRDGILSYLATNHRIRGTEGRMPPPESILVAREFGPGIVLTTDDLTITAAPNSHYSLTDFGGAHASYALRFDGGGRSIVFTGDTGESDDVVSLARGADILVAEMVTPADAERVPPAVRAHMEVEHLTPTQVGRLAAAAGVGTVVLSHYTDASDDDLAAIRAEFAGTVAAGADLDVF